MSPLGSMLPPSVGLPTLRTLHQLTAEQVFLALQSLSAIYCPLPVSLASIQKPSHAAPASGIIDSGYTSGAENEDKDAESLVRSLAALRADAFERNAAERWLTGFIARAEELPCLDTEEARQNALDQASCVLESFYAGPVDEDETAEDTSFTRDFQFEVSLPDSGGQATSVKVSLNDGLAGTDPTDPDDVGLQSWGASIVLSELFCSSPERFGFTKNSLGNAPRIYELGAGTGLVSLVLGALLPRLDIKNWLVVATDYHPAVLANLGSNIERNFSSNGSLPVTTALLDWFAPSLESPLDQPADMLIATDAVYAPEHATWLCDCASGLLSANGVFWLLVTVRQNGRFQGISETVETAFAAEDRPTGKDGRRLTILDSEKLKKRKGVGRGDESGYELFRIGWA